MFRRRPYSERRSAPIRVASTITLIALPLLLLYNVTAPTLRGDAVLAVDDGSSLPPPVLVTTVPPNTSAEGFLPPSDQLV